MGVNPAFEALTGYSREEAVGRNCRFLQGVETEEDALLQLVVCLRSERSAQIKITNYKKNGTRFTNLLSLHPVHDWHGSFRYVIALLADADLASAEERDLFERLASILPDHLDVELQPPKYAQTASLPSEWLKARRMASQMAFAPLLWLEEPDVALTVLARDEELLDIFHEELRSCGRQVGGEPCSHSRPNPTLYTLRLCRSWSRL